MEFATRIRELAERIQVMKASISTEEATKTAILLPLFSALGYDVFNPSEVVPEYVADVGIKRGEKVDYALFKNGLPIILVEAKAIGKKLDKHDSQLFRYFGTTKAKVAILTNGLQYKFYTDIDEPNKMDLVPFYELNLLSLSDKDIVELERFSKHHYEESHVFENASLLKYAATFRSTLQTEFANPSDDLVRFFLQNCYKGVKTQNVVNRFRPVVTKAIQDYMGDLVRENLTNMVNTSTYTTVTTATETKSEPSSLEIDLLVSIKSLLNDAVDMEQITYKKTESYFAVLLNNNVRKWIVRISISGGQITLVFPEPESRYKISNVAELQAYAPQLLASLHRLIGVPEAEPVRLIHTKWGTYPYKDDYHIYLKYGLPPVE